ncbi:hypothetical protein [Chryseobacterium sp. ZHDP1]|uniref:hypothetical protein n=1 Tax=Chryseobacterium sp. ZHDP1 TaxID=2838877 RepID=UPI001BDF95C5|nr:hypothetical protein [Chryseobacterium sp. ZHDP1]QWA38862.1 hypothetical protein KKI44_01220 [Chryseobacterium sp. ZHDP1]
MKKVLAVLGLQAFTFHNNFWGAGEAHVKLDNKQLQLIEDALEKNEAENTPAEGAESLADLQAKVSGFEANEISIQEAVTAALNLNGIEAAEGQTVAQAIEALGTKCKEYGDSKETHSIIQTDGKEKPAADGLQNGFYDPKAPHNQI